MTPTEKALREALEEIQDDASISWEAARFGAGLIAEDAEVTEASFKRIVDTATAALASLPPEPSAESDTALLREYYGCHQGGSDPDREDCPCPLCVTYRKRVALRNAMKEAERGK